MIQENKKHIHNAVPLLRLVHSNKRCLIVITVSYVRHTGEQTQTTCLREKGPPQFYPGEGCKDFLAVTPRLRVCCHSELGILDLVNATDVFVSINENTPSSSVFHGRTSEMFQSIRFVFDVIQQASSTSLNTFIVFV